MPSIRGNKRVELPTTIEEYIVGWLPLDNLATLYRVSRQARIFLVHFLQLCATTVVTSDPYGIKDDDDDDKRGGGGGGGFVQTCRGFSLLSRFAQRLKCLKVHPAMRTTPHTVRMLTKIIMRNSPWFERLEFIPGASVNDLTVWLALRECNRLTHWYAVNNRTTSRFPDVMGDGMTLHSIHLKHVVYIDMVSPLTSSGMEMFAGIETLTLVVCRLEPTTFSLPFSLCKLKLGFVELTDSVCQRLAVVLPLLVVLAEVEIKVVGACRLSDLRAPWCSNSVRKATIEFEGPLKGTGFRPHLRMCALTHFHGNLTPSGLVSVWRHSSVLESLNTRLEPAAKNVHRVALRRLFTATKSSHHHHQQQQQHQQHVVQENEEEKKKEERGAGTCLHTLIVYEKKTQVSLWDSLTLYAFAGCCPQLSTIHLSVSFQYFGDLSHTQIVEFFLQHHCATLEECKFKKSETAAFIHQEGRRKTKKKTTKSLRGEFSAQEREQEQKQKQKQKERNEKEKGREEETPIVLSRAHTFELPIWNDHLLRTICLPVVTSLSLTSVVYYKHANNNNLHETQRDVSRLFASLGNTCTDLTLDSNVIEHTNMLLVTPLTMVTHLRLQSCTDHSLTRFLSLVLPQLTTLSLWFSETDTEEARNVMQIVLSVAASTGRALQKVTKLFVTLYQQEAAQDSLDIYCMRLLTSLPSLVFFEVEQICDVSITWHYHKVGKNWIKIQ